MQPTPCNTPDEEAPETKRMLDEVLEEVLAEERAESLKSLPERFPVDKRIEMHPATDQWMRGARYGSVRKVDGKTGLVHVKLDKIKKILRCAPADLLERDPTKDFGFVG